MDIINNINRIFTNNCSYKIINQLSTKKLRNIKDGVKLDEAIYYRFKYTAKNTTKSSIVADINYNSENNNCRQAFYLKEKRIPYSSDVNLLTSVISSDNQINISNKSFINSKNNNDHLIAIDLTHNLNNKSKVMSNLGISDYQKFTYRHRFFFVA